MISLRKWQKSDNVRIEILEKLYFKSPWNLAMLDSCFDIDNFYGLVLEDNEKVVAYIGCSYDLWDADILNICVDSVYRRQGLATKLLQEVIKHFKTLNAERIYLEVRVSNLPAVNLYKSLGFEQIGLRKKYYENTEDAYVMAISL